MSAIKSFILNLPNNKIPLTHNSLIFTVSHHDCLCPCSSLLHMCFSLTLPFRLFHACLLYSLLPPSLPSQFPSPCWGLSNILTVLTYSAHRPAAAVLHMEGALLGFLHEVHSSNWIVLQLQEGRLTQALHPPWLLFFGGVRLMFGCGLSLWGI